MASPFNWHFVLACDLSQPKESEFTEQNDRNYRRFNKYVAQFPSIPSRDGSQRKRLTLCSLAPENVCGIDFNRLVVLNMPGEFPPKADALNRDRRSLTTSGANHSPINQSLISAKADGPRAQTNIKGKRLTDQQKTFYGPNGYIIGLPPVFATHQVKELNDGLNEVMKLLRPGEDSKEIREWHESSRFLYDICTNDTILDYVEDILGPDFYLWGSNFFIKPPHSNSTVGWHQDTYCWPLEPKISATVWLALDDVDEQNAAMKVIPGSHKAGQISIHDDKLVHGSPANNSDRRRAGLTIRYSSTIVKCDLTVNPHFTTYLCRGVDEYKHNPVGTEPTQKYARLDRKHISVEEAGVEAERKLGLVK